MREMLLFSDRKKLADLFEQLADENNVLKCGESLTAFLSVKGLLREKEADQMIEENQTK